MFTKQLSAYDRLPPLKVRDLRLGLESRCKRETLLKGLATSKKVSNSLKYFTTKLTFILHKSKPIFPTLPIESLVKWPLSIDNIK